MAIGRRLPAFAVLALLAACNTESNPVADSGQPDAVQNPMMAVRDEAVVPSRVLVKVREGVELARVARGRGLEIAEERRGFAILQGAAAGAERRVARELAADANVEWAEPDYLRQ